MTTRRTGEDVVGASASLPLGEPSSIDEVRRERDAASARARALEHELGELRSQVKRMELRMWRRTTRREYLRSVVARGQAFAERVRRAVTRRLVRTR